MDELYIQHPLPWVADDNRDGHMGDVKVFDASGSVMVFTGEMEDCTYADILLSYLWSAAPDLLAACRAAHRVLLTFEQLGLITQGHEQRALELVRDALAKAYGKNVGEHQE